MSSNVITISEGMKMKKQNNTKIGVGSVAKAKVGDLEKITRERRIRKTRKEAAGFLHAVVGKNNNLVQF